LKPVLQALVLAERVYQVDDGKKIIAGTFDTVYFTKSPVVKEVNGPGGTKQKLLPGGMHGGSPYAYLSLTDVCDQTKLVLHFVNLTKNKVLFGKEIEIPSTDRLRTVEIVLALPLLPISEAGTYAFQVLCEGEILGSHRLTAQELTFE
jgi:hypothetical protein